jgi:signal-transduction protein with cAMP-binding, CBS, and nucleotidyltransferase domain
MTRNVRTIGVEESILDAARIMNRYEISSIIAVENGNPAGIVTERDILKRVIARRKNPETTTISAVMSTPLTTINSSTSASRALRKMVKNNIKKLGVTTRTNRLVGVLSLTDLMPIIDAQQSKSKIPLEKIPKRMKKAFEIYYDPIRQIRKRCPLTMSGGSSISCIGSKCMWYVGDRCVFLNLAARA